MIRPLPPALADGSDSGLPHCGQTKLLSAGICKSVWLLAKEQ
jgi:hypothetical protein